MANRFDILQPIIPTQTPLLGMDIFGTKTTTPVTIPKEEGTLPTIQRGIETILPGVKAIRESIQQGSLEPEKEFLERTAARLTTPEGMVESALGIGLTAPINVTADTALSRLVSAIKSAKPARKEIEALATKERAIRAGRATGVLERVEGEKAFIQAKGQLKGPLIPEKPRFEPLRGEPVIPSISPDLQSLAQEARKYKSAEEFVNNQSPIFHRTQAQFYSFDISKKSEKALGLHFFGTREMANQPTAIKRFGDKIIESYPQGKIADLGIRNVVPDVADIANLRGQALRKALESRGYIGFKMAEEVVIFEPKNVLTKSQLTDFYNQATKGIIETGKLTQLDIDTLFVQIQRHPNLTTFEKISAADGFSQLMLGEIPQPSKLSLLEDVFGKELIEETLKKRGALDKFKDFTTEVLNIPRSLMASFDMSAPLRQGVIFTVTKPTSAVKAGYEMFKQAFSEKNYVGWLDDIKKDSLYPIMKDSDLYIADPRRVSGGLAAREERFMSNLAEKIPIIGAGVRAAERAYTSYLNKLRVDVFSSIATKFQKMGLPQKENPELYKSLAGYVNNATGRGDLGKLNRNSQILNTLFFSPRLIASRFNMLNPVWYAKQPAPVRKEAIKNFAEFVGVGTTILTLAKLAGADVEIDPRSTDFGKIKIGNTRWDIWGGFQQWIRVFSQIASGARKTQKGEIIELTKKKFPFETRFDVTERFLRGKLAPIPALALELFEGSKMFGEELKFTTEFAENLTPLYLQDIKESFEQLGPWSMLTVGAPAFFGIGVQTYEEKKKENRFNF